MNDIGQVVGQSSVGTPFVWSKSSGFVELAGSDFAPGIGAIYPIARDINNHGQVAGDIFNPYDGGPNGVTWTRPNIQYEYVPRLYSPTTIAGINQSGALAGKAVTVHGGQAVAYGRDSSGNYMGIGLPSLHWACVTTLCYGSNAAATALNDQNVVVGWSNTLRDQVWVNDQLPFPPETHAMLWHVIPDAANPTVGDWQDLGTLRGASNSEAHAINNKDIVVGDSDKHAFSWSAASGMVPLDPAADDSSSASAINDNDWIVGNLSGPKGKRASLWRSNATVVDLNLVSDLLHSDFSTLSAATDINELDDIIGSGLARDGSTHAFLLTPIPEARAWLLMLVGLACVVSATSRAGVKQLSGLRGDGRQSA